MKIRPLCILMLLNAGLFAAGSALAESLNIRSVAETSGALDTGAAKLKRPSRGMSKNEVVKKFGRPIKKLKPVGANPKRRHHRPISRWIYDDYMVVFDADFVIDTVSRRKAPAPTH